MNCICESVSMHPLLLAPVSVSYERTASTSFLELKTTSFVMTSGVNGAACAQWDQCCRLAAGSNSGRQLSADFPSKQTKAEGGGTAEPGSGPRPVGRSAGTHRRLAVFWNDSMLLMFFLRLLLSSCGAKLTAVDRWLARFSVVDRPHVNPTGAGIRAPVNEQFAWLMVIFAGETYFRPVFKV